MVELKKEEVILLQSPNDKNKYRYLKLDNELEVILVSDETADQASACLTVNIGSLSNPSDIDGLAHFLEHMLFLGTEKYPVEKEFTNYIHLNGGSYNGTTSANKTNYYFTVNQGSFKEALDRFSSFFVCPLMNKDAVDRELNAVDSEHNNNLQKDVWRISRIMNNQYEDHPMSSFFTGNSGTLKREDIRERVVEFYNKYYSANLMKLCIYGRESLDELEVYTREYFSAIANKHTVLPSFPPLTLKDGKSIWIEAEPAKDMDILKFEFPVPDEKLCFSKNYKNSSSTILSHILGHEAKGSLLSVLSKKGFALSLSCGNNSTYDNMNKFEITIFLTKLGLENIDEIVALLFQSFDFDTPKYMFDEKQLINRENWLSFQKSLPSSTTTAISSNLFRVQTPADTLKYNHFYEEFDPVEIKAIQSYLRPDNMVVLFYSLEKFRGKTEHTEKFYNINFNKRYLGQEDFNKWKSFPKEKGLYVPAANPYVPKDFTIKATQDQSIQVPKQIYSENGVTVYHAMDHRFNSPKARVNIRFETAQHGNNQAMVMWILLKKCIGEVLNEDFIYYLKIMEFTMKTIVLTTHTELSCYGFNDKIFEAILQFFEFYYSINPTDAQFETCKDRVNKRFINSHFFSPYQIAARSLTLHTYNCNSNLLEKQEYLKSVTKDEFIAWVRNLFSSINFTVMVVGNASVEDAESFGMKLNQFKRSKLCVGDVFTLSRVNLKPSTETHLKEYLSDFAQTNCASIVNFLCGTFTRKNYAIVSVLSTILNSSFFDEIRTKRQYGYVVAVMVDNLANSHTFRFVVQSHTVTPDQIYDTTMEFIDGFEKDVLDQFEANPEAFKDLIDNCKEQTIVKQISNSAQSTIYWSNFICYNDFEFEKKKYQDIDSLTLDDIRQFFKQYLQNRETRAVFVAQLYPQSMKFEQIPPPSKDSNIKVIHTGQHYKFRNDNGYLPSSLNL